MELIHLFGQDALCAIVLSLDYAVDLGVDLSRRLLGIVAPGGEISAEEHLVVRVLAAENDRSELGAHAVFCDHIAGDIRCALNVV